MNILIIEDDIILANNLKKIFEKKVIVNQIIVENTYNWFLNVIDIIESFDIIILDIILECKDKKTWIDIIKIIRDKSYNIPIVVISAFSELEWIETAFNVWASDYIIKPFRLKEIEIRILKWFKVYLKSLNFSGNEIIEYNDLTYSVKENQFYFKNNEIKLTKKSKYILLILLSSAEKLITDRLLIEKIWCDRGDILDRNLRICILRLKKSLISIWIDGRIKNIRGEWYTLKK